jgi:hypothetical protein
MMQAMMSNEGISPTRVIWSAVVVGFLSSLFGCDRKEQAETTHVSPYTQADVYRDLREHVLKQSYEKTVPPDDSTKAVAVFMETGYPEAVATLMAAADGTTSLYFSNGGGVIGGGEHEPVRVAAASFLNLASTFVDDMQATETYPLPTEGSVRFYVVHRNGVRTAEAVEDDLGNMRHKLSSLFHQGHEVIAAIRENTPQTN